MTLQYTLHLDTDEHNFALVPIHNDKNNWIKNNAMKRHKKMGIQYVREYYSKLYLDIVNSLRSTLDVLFE